MMAYVQKPVIRIVANEKKGKFRNFFIKISNSEAFELFILGCIILNTCVLAAHWYEMPESVVLAFEKVNYTFMAIFTVEAIIKLIAQKRLYFKDSWNLFDFIVVVCTAIVVIMA